MADNNGVATQFRSGRPTFTVAGQEQAALGGGLLNLLIVENTTGLYRCEALFGNWGPINGQIDFLYFGRDLLEFGKGFVVKMGTDTLFEGRIMGLEGRFPEGRPPEIVVLAEDRFQDLRMTRRTRSFEDMSDSDVINQIANDHGLRPDVSLDGPTYRVLAQINQSDLAFMRERARIMDAELWMDGSTLKARTRRDRNGATLGMSYGSELREFTVLADLANQRTSVTVSGWDVSNKSELKFEATESAISSELKGDSSGASILSSTLGERKEALAHKVPLTSSEAQLAAESYFKQSARRFLVGHGVAQTDSRLRVGNIVDLKKLGPLFSGKYYLSEVRHLFDGALGIRTEFTAERAGLGQG